MDYEYRAERPRLFTEPGVEMLTAIRDNVRELLAKSGAVRWQEAVAGIGGDSWLMLACFDYMVERGEIREVTKGQDVAGQHRVFVSAKG